MITIREVQNAEVSKKDRLRQIIEDCLAKGDKVAAFHMGDHEGGLKPVTHNEIRVLLRESEKG